ncbi:Eco57I restriction-modification methylase domain-containing protein [Streptococcus mutans]|uniref:Eco57I restriction-modification methylase domain-containing protein n=1 Tax=Streptococcus mutans TaxID=1309 RepID=UPI0002B510D0|nr:Eco57I restriction-modification methylase domain-containing protein [Streptococcus mutans]EMB73704.1 type II restriction-modification system restriction subunit [Streptococcus mutans 4VF1]EMC30513.1 type II restriction-modification system restriction subunit [Streptococcus mutans NLML1]
MGTKYFDYLTKYESILDEYLGLKDLKSSITFYRKSIPQDPSMIGMAVRRLLETSVNYLITKNRISDNRNHNLFEKINLLENKKVISKNLKQSFHKIRKLGNKGAHGDDLTVNVAETVLAEFDKALRLILKEHNKPVQTNVIESDNMTIVTYATFDRKLIYIQSANTESGGYDAYLGLEKIGDASVPNNLEADLRPNSKYLRDYAEHRINQYMNTAGVPYTLHWAQLAVDNNQHFFRDHDVHLVLKRSGFAPIPLGQDEHGKPNEWFKIDIDTAKRAIEAVKEGRTSLDLTSKIGTPPIELRPEQKKAIKQTKAIFKEGNHMLWNAKMRFGKTLTALQLIKECQFKKVLIMTHRPVVSDGWFEDFSKIFTENDNYIFGSKNKGEKIEKLVETDRPFIYFASIQDLRGSKWAGGKQGDKNNEFLVVDWDFVIIDEAHEGTETELANRMKDRLINEQTKILELSGTPFNLLDKYDEDNIFTWDYTMEQSAKEKWSQTNPDDPNPYESLPKVLMYTFDVSNKFNYIDENKAFNFKEFFRVEEGNPDKFVYETDVIKFLDYISTNDNKNNFPYSSKEFRDQLRHTLWLLPGVKEARALELLLKEHQVFETYNIVNVVRNGDDTQATQSDLNQVRKAIGNAPSQTRTITLTVRKLTTGVNIPEWTGIVFLSNTESPTSYLQAAFRAQTPFNNEKMGVKQQCYIFDFAPDRALKIMSESVGLTSKKGKVNSTEQKEKLTNMLNFLPILGQEGNSMRTFSVDQMMTKLKKAYAEKAVRTGFEDSSLYNDNLLNLSDVDLTAFRDLKQIIGKAGNKSKQDDFVVISKNGFAIEEYDKAAKAERKKRKERSSEEEARVKELQARRKQRAAMISILRGVSIRIPMMIYGMNVDIDDDITIDTFINQVDEESWEEFMPKGLTKKKFKEFTKYYDADVFVEAGRIIRHRAKSYDNLDVIERTEKVAELFSSFKNPDKETVLTPWRVVNMQLISTLGGYSFFDNSFENTTIDGKSANHWVETDETTAIYQKNINILDINAKTGLYPLFAATSLYYKRMLEVSEEQAGKVDSQELWKTILKNNIYALAKTPMAKTITERTLSGYKSYRTNVRFVDNLVDTMKTSLEEAKTKIEEAFNHVKFDVVIGNPPYQEEINNKETNHGQQKRVKNVFHYFQMETDYLKPKYAVLIYPAVRWIHQSGKGMKQFGIKQINDYHLSHLIYYPNANNVFNDVAIADGISIVLKDYSKKSDTFLYSFINSNNSQVLERHYPGEEPLILNPSDASIVEKIDNLVVANHLNYLSTSKTINQKLFQIESDFVERNPDKIEIYNGQAYNKKHKLRLLTNDKAGKIGRATWFIVDRDAIKVNQDLVDKYKVVVSSANAGGQKRDNQIEVLPKGTAFGRSRIALKAFDTKEEAYNFYKYCQSFLIRFAFLMTDENLSSLARKVPDLKDYTSKNPYINFNQDINQQLYNMFNLNKREIKYIIERVSSIR